MSQVLRLTANLKRNTLIPNVLNCSACQKLRYGLNFSTNPNLKPPHSLGFKKKKWKKKDNVFKKLTQSLDALQAQMATSTGNPKFSHSHRSEIPVLIQNKTSKDGHVRQGVYYVGNSFKTENIDRLEKQIGEKTESVTNKEANLSDRKQSSFSKSNRQNKTDSSRVLNSSVIHKHNNKNLQANPVINRLGDVKENSYPVISDSASNLSQTIKKQNVYQYKLKHFRSSTNLTSSHLSNRSIKEIWIEGKSRGELFGKPRKVSLKYENSAPHLWNGNGKHKQKDNSVKVVSKPAHVKNVPLASKPEVTSSLVKESNSNLEDIESINEKNNATLSKLKEVFEDANQWNGKGKHKQKDGVKVVSKPAYVKKAPLGSKPEVTSSLVKETLSKLENVVEDVKENKNVNEKDNSHFKDSHVVKDSSETQSKSKSKSKHKKEKQPDLSKPVKHSGTKSEGKQYAWQSPIFFNMDLKAFVEACCYLGWDQRALAAVRYYREQKHAGIERYEITDIEIYNCLIRCSAEKGDLKSIIEVSSMLHADKVKPNLLTYALSLYCLEKNIDVDPLIAQYMLQDMEKQGLDVNDIFTKLTFVGDEKQAILQVLRRVYPDFETPQPDSSHMNTGPLVSQLNTPLPKSEMVEVNPYAGVISAKEILKKADEQFTRELENYASVRSIWKKDSDTLSEQSRKEGEEKLEKLRKTWRIALRKKFRSKLYRMEKKFIGTNELNLYPYFKLLPEEVYIDILMKELEWLEGLHSFFSETTSLLHRRLGQNICDRFNMQVKAESDILPKLKQVFMKYTERMMDPNTDQLNHRLCWKDIQKELYGDVSLEVEEKSWPSLVKKAVGKELYEIIISEVKIPVIKHGEEKKVPAFYTVIRNKDSTIQEEIKPHPKLEELTSCKDNLVFQPSELPLVIPPLPWVSPTQGVNFFSTEKTVRRYTDRQMDMFKSASDTGPVLDSLNVLGACPWRVNKPILDLIIKMFNSGGNIQLDIPITPASIEKPKKVNKRLKLKEWVAAFKEKHAYKKSVNEANSLWHGALYKFSIANMFRDDVFWFSHNLDFRGRTYAIPPHFNHLGGDTSRAIIQFAKGRPLGPNGLNWIKIHLVNLTGLKKRSSNAERLQYADERMVDILDSADKPLNGRRWWTTSEEPWQTLACCMEIAAATRSKDPAKFVSHFPVHQDGSCNGLQHYAALGRDTAGAKSVNLFPFDRPSDVYQEVVELVEKKRQRDLLEGDDITKEVAKLCEGHVERKVIKQTIMTTVYGVTKYGAELQIARQLKERGMPRADVLKARKYLARSTFYCLAQMFVSARQIQDWFDACALSISKISRKPVEWVTPLNFPVVQPYFRYVRNQNYGTSHGTFGHEHQNPSAVKQKNAFAPNYIHSLDSTHMMLTSLHCLRAGITFVSVHDCFWTHPCNVEVMNKITREQFVSLHSQPILENLSKYFTKTFCTLPIHDHVPVNTSSSQPGTQPQSVNDDSVNQSETTSRLHNTSDSVALMELDSIEKTSPLMVLNKSDSTDMIISERSREMFEDLEANRSFNCSTNIDTGEMDNDFNQLDVRLSDTILDSDDIDEVNDISAKILDTHNELELNQSESELNQSNNYSIDCDETELRHSAELSETQSLKSSKGETNQNAEKMIKKKYTEQEKMARLQQVLTAVPERGDFDLTEVIKSTYFFS